MSADIEHLITDTVRLWKADVTIAAIQPLTPDASLRRYFRVRLNNTAPNQNTIIAMIFDSVVPPEVGKGRVVNSDESYISLSQFFKTNGVAVPLLYFDGRERSILLIEDLGDCLLGTMIVGESSALFSAQERERVYRAAIDELIRIQRIPAVNDFFPFQRRFDQALYLKEMEEFTEFFLPQFSPNTSQLSECRQLFARLATEVEGLPYALAHRDFHSWNLMLDPRQTVRVIDFQDALMAPRVYDLAALLNDRDTDIALGESLAKKLRVYFAESSQYGPSFEVDYHRALLQRDLKVVGRFAKLVSLRGLTGYGQWIPGTYRRVRRGVEFLIKASAAPEYQKFSDCLDQLVPADHFGGSTK